MSLVNRSKGRANALMGLHNNSNAGADEYSAMLRQLQTLAGEAGADADLSTEDLFGEAIDRNTRQSQAQANSIRESLGRLSMARGDSGTGRTAAAALGATESSNRNIGDFRVRMEQLATGERGRARQRELAILSQILGGKGALMNRADNMFMNERQLNEMQNQASRQQRSDMFGQIFGLGGAFLNPGGGS